MKPTNEIGAYYIVVKGRRVVRSYNQLNGGTEAITVLKPTRYELVYLRVGCQENPKKLPR